MLEDASLPFFIAWDDPARHPALEPVAHENQPNGIAWIEIAADETRLKEWLGPDDLPVTVVGGEPGVRAVAIATARGEIVLR
jgi:hypothetical protein